MTAQARGCAGCGAALPAGQRAGARWCGDSCRKRAERIGTTPGLTSQELGWPPGEYPARSARLWAGMAALNAQTANKAAQRPGRARKGKPWG